MAITNSCRSELPRNNKYEMMTREKRHIYRCAAAKREMKINKNDVRLHYNTVRKINQFFLEA